MKLCKTFGCPNLVEGTTEHCGSCNSSIRKIAKQRQKAVLDKEVKLSTPQQPRAKVKKLGDSNTWSCSSGKRVTQTEIYRFRESAYNYQALAQDVTKCAGCGQPATCRAHVIAQARCKQIGKTELIWHLGNFFPSCFGCNSAIENPKGSAWKTLKNIDACIQFIYEHDMELYFKFEAQGWLSKNEK